MTDSTKYRVVAIDDDLDSLKLIHLTLEPEYEVITIQDPAQALDALEFLESDILIVDVMMPKITGYHIVEKLKSDTHNASTQVIFLSAKDSALDIRYGYKLGANLYLTKPIQPERVKRGVEMLVSQSATKHPRTKMLSLRDIDLRLRNRMGVTPARGSGKILTPLPEHPAVHRAPKAATERDDGEDNKEKNWVG